LLQDKAENDPKNRRAIFSFISSLDHGRIIILKIGIILKFYNSVVLLILIRKHGQAPQAVLE